MFELKTFIFDTMLNHYLFQKLKLIEKCKFNYLINTLTLMYIFNRINRVCNSHMHF